MDLNLSTKKLNQIKQVNEIMYSQEGKKEINLNLPFFDLKYNKIDIFFSDSKSKINKSNEVIKNTIYASIVSCLSWIF